MNYRKHIALFMYLLIAGYTVSAQKIYVGYGNSTASFQNFDAEKYQSSAAEKAQERAQKSYSAGMLLNLFKEGNNKKLSSGYKLDIGIAVSELQMKNGIRLGAVVSPLVYNLNMFSVKTGLNILILRVADVKIQTHGHVSYAWLVSGSRTFEGNTIDLKEDTSFEQSYLNAHFGADIAYPISPKVTLYTSYDFSNSFGGNKGIEESYPISVHTFSVGLRLGGKEYYYNGR